MKKISILMVLTAVLFCLSTTSCLSSTSNLITKGSQTITMDVNAPKNNLAAIGAELVIKGYDNSYNGIITMKISGAPTVDNLKPLTKYISYCNAIKTALDKTGTQTKLTYHYIDISGKDKTLALDPNNQAGMINALLTVLVTSNPKITAQYK